MFPEGRKYIDPKPSNFGVPWLDPTKGAGSWQIPSLKLTASLPLKMDGWNTTFLLGWPIFRCYVSFREGKGCRLGLVVILKMFLMSSWW